MTRTYSGFKPIPKIVNFIHCKKYAALNSPELLKLIVIAPHLGRPRQQSIRKDRRSTAVLFFSLLLFSPLASSFIDLDLLFLIHFIFVFLFSLDSAAFVTQPPVPCLFLSPIRMMSVLIKESLSPHISQWGVLEIPIREESTEFLYPHWGFFCFFPLIKSITDDLEKWDAVGFSL